jgi:hypothetical protein
VGAVFEGADAAHLRAEIRNSKIEIRPSFDFRISIFDQGDTMKIRILRYGLLAISALMAIWGIVCHPDPSEFLSHGDPTQLTRPAMPAQGNGTAVKITTPQGTRWTYVDFSQGKSLAEFLNDMGEDLFGKAAYAQSAAEPEIRNSKIGDRQSPITNHQSQITDSITPRVPNMVHLVARHRDGTIFYDQWVHNLRTNAGINWQYGQMAGGTAAVCTYIALSNSGATPAATDTALASEITSNGLARADGSPSHTSNATSYTLSYTFTATGTQSAQNAGMLNASSSGTLCFENTFSQVNMNSGDTLAVTWTVNF